MYDSNAYLAHQAKMIESWTKQPRKARKASKWSPLKAKTSRARRRAARGTIANPYRG